MARSSLLDGFAYGVLNEILGTFRTQDGGYAKPSRYEVIIGPPAKYSQQTGAGNNKSKEVSKLKQFDKKDIITITGKLKSIDTKLNQTYRDIQNNNIPVDKNLLDERIYKKNMIEKIKEWKKKSDNGDKKNWKSFYKEENLHNWCY